MRVLYRRTAMAIKMANLFGTFLSSFHLLLPWQRLGQYGVNSCPMAASSGFPGVALDMPHLAMLSVLLHRSAVAIEMAGG
jgi:hypothetical protein